MEERLKKLYKQCIHELNNVGLNTSEIGKIDIIISKRNNKRYGCCKQSEPDESTKYIQKGRCGKIIKYAKYNKHIIEISPWVMLLQEKIIKNTIMHEIIHCFPLCNNHGTEFKKYAKCINEELRL